MEIKATLATAGDPLYFSPRPFLRSAQQKEGKDNTYPSYEALKAEQEEDAPKLVFSVRDASGQVVRQWTQSPAKGIQRVTWDLRYAPKDPISFRFFCRPNNISDPFDLCPEYTFLWAANLFKIGYLPCGKNAKPTSLKILNHLISNLLECS